ncbi:zinc-binding dehydrogenase [Actinomadura kijaniata]|uniref:Threonine dehydrogenase-like Zn-dependent dehydrogenase n=1 Tax=Actinomadura namibiensis TaxID=182080 RepID=A0A7W3LZQ3_ACTNM|nr:zinc-binding dehydrogenase [Actinomadura namibiensis]MBA8957334.1 threonine dehydrogenase-like Zn-dependent dehydrogenase [Actinomadura namibiensis]
MSQRVQAAVFDGKGGCEIREFPMPSPPRGGAVLKVAASGMCGSDVAQFHGHKHVPGEVSPVVPGHEIVGTIHEITPEAAADWGVEAGDLVCVSEVVSCGRCKGCMSGGLCGNIRVYGYTFPADANGGPWGGYGQYMGLLPGSQVMKAPPGLTPAELTVFEPLANALNWIDMLRVVPGDRVVVQGPGHQGLLCAAAALAYGAAQVIVTGAAGDGLRLRTARELGAHDTVDASETDVIETVAELTKGDMADVVLDVSPSPHTTTAALELARVGGRVGLAGLKGLTPDPELVTDLIVLKMLRVVGCAGPTRASMLQSVRLLGDRPDIARVMAGEHVSLETVEYGLDLLQRRVPGQDTVHVTLVH